MPNEVRSQIYEELTKLVTLYAGVGKKEKEVDFCFCL